MERKAYRTVTTSGAIPTPQIPMQSGIISSVTSTIDTYVYNGLMKLGDVGMSSAASFYQSIVGFILVMFSNWLVKKCNVEGSLF